MNLWGEAGVPHKGWTLQSVYDVCGGDPDAPLSSCDFCGTAIRYIHVIEHSQWQDTVEVGCICCESLTGDYVTPKTEEQSLAKVARRRLCFLRSPRWYRSAAGNLTITYKGNRVTIFKNATGFRAVAAETFSKRQYATELLAQAAAFNFLERTQNPRRGG